MHFCPQGTAGPHALILDKVVAAWLGQHTDLQLNPASWSPATYSRYLDALDSWAGELAVRPSLSRSSYSPGSPKR